MTFWFSIFSFIPAAQVRGSWPAMHPCLHLPIVRSLFSCFAFLKALPIALFSVSPVWLCLDHLVLGSIHTVTSFHIHSLEYSYHKRFMFLYCLYQIFSCQTLSLPKHLLEPPNFYDRLELSLFTATPQTNQKNSEIIVCKSHHPVLP